MIAQVGADSVEDYDEELILDDDLQVGPVADAPMRAVTTTLAGGASG